MRYNEHRTLQNKYTNSPYFTWRDNLKDILLISFLTPGKTSLYKSNIKMPVGIIYSVLETVQVHPAALSFSNKMRGHQVKRLLFIFMVCKRCLKIILLHAFL